MHFRCLIVQILTMSCLIAFVSAIRIECEYIEENFVITQCNTEALTVTQPNEAVTSISGTLSRVINYENIKVFQISDSPNLDFIPRGVEKFFPKLEQLIVTRTGLKHLRNDDLKHFLHLKVLDLSENQLEKLDANSLKYNQAIEKIDLSSNNIREVPKHFLKVTKHLKSVDMTNNICFNNTAGNLRELKIMESKLSQCSSTDFGVLEIFAYLAIICLFAFLLIVVLVACINRLIGK